MEQYILKPEGELTGYVNTTFTKKGKNRDASQGTSVKPIFTASCACQGGDVVLDKVQEYLDYNRETVCITNPYTFVNTINNTYETGHAALLYMKVIDRELTEVTGVMPVNLYDNYTTVESTLPCLLNCLTELPSTSIFPAL